MQKVCGVGWNVAGIGEAVRRFSRTVTRISRLIVLRLFAFRLKPDDSISRFLIRSRHLRCWLAVSAARLEMDPVIQAPPNPLMCNLQPSHAPVTTLSSSVCEIILTAHLPLSNTAPRNNMFPPLSHMPAPQPQHKTCRASAPERNLQTRRVLKPRFTIKPRVRTTHRLSRGSHAEHAIRTGG